jgi:hypothetical protein
MVPAAVLELSALIVVAILYFRNRGQERWHAPVRLALE